MIEINVPRDALLEFVQEQEDFSTTFWTDFSIADAFGPAAVRDTYNRAFAEWKHDYRYLTDLVMVLNHKIWQWYERDETMADMYDKLWNEASVYAEEHLGGDERDYYYRLTD